MLFACNNPSKQNMSTESQDSTRTKIINSAKSYSVKTNSGIEAAKKFDFKNPDRPIEDTLILRTAKGNFEISPTGLLETIEKNTVQLETDLIVEKAFIYEDKKYFYLFFTDTDHESATSWIQKIEKESLKTVFTSQINGFNLGQPIIQRDKSYLTAIGFVGKIDLVTGDYDWKYQDLYDNNKYSFNSFDTIIIQDNQIEFLSENYKSKNLDRVIIESKTGKIIGIEK